MRVLDTAVAETLAAPTWRARARAHAQRVDTLVGPHRRRRREGRSHPVEDFLFTYYRLPPGRLRCWHPGAGVALQDATDRRDWRWYRQVGSGAVIVDAEAYRADRSAMLDQAADVLAATLQRPGHYGCFGMHEWAMVYRRRADEVRHPYVPLRLGSAATDAVVESHRIRCTHFDAFRFFTAEAAPRNEVTPTRTTAPKWEQPGCLHAGMDCYRWAIALGPLVPGEVLLACFELAREIRSMDMRASPYDLREWGYEPVPVETAEGKAQYVQAQRGFAERANGLRRRLLACLGQAGCR